MHAGAQEEVQDEDFHERALCAQNDDRFGGASGRGFRFTERYCGTAGNFQKYLEQIIPILNRSNFLQANRGAQGGYRLAKAPSAYTVKDILELTEGSLAPVACLDTMPVGCERSEFCVTLPLWKGLRDAIEKYLDGITLQDLLDRQTEMYSNNYMI